MARGTRSPYGTAMTATAWLGAVDVQHGLGDELGGAGG
jgi:hypothetical protein